MKKYWKIIAGCLAFCILMAGSVILYNQLKKNYGPGQNLETGDPYEEENGQPEAGSDEAGEGDNLTGEGKDPEDIDGTTEEGSGGKEDKNGGTEDENNQSEDENKAPDFRVENVDGESVSLASMEGKPVVLNFWASWCPPCKSEMPDFQKAYETYGEDIRFMMVNLTDGSRETKETAAAYIEEQGYTFPVYFDVEQEAAYAFYVSALPATYFIDENGVVVAAGRGMLDEEALQKGISYLIPQ